MGFQSSDMRFATEQAFRRSCVKAELTFEPHSLMKGIISSYQAISQTSKSSKFKPDHQYKYVRATVVFGILSEKITRAVNRFTEIIISLENYNRY